MDTEEISAVPKNTAPEDYYHDPSSVYIKLTYLPEAGGFKFEIRNELIRQFTPETVPDAVKSVSAFVRGMCELAMRHPHDMYCVGIDALNKDFVQNADGLTEDQRELLMNCVGEA